MKRFLLTLSFLTLTAAMACANDPPATSTDTCGIAQYLPLVGQRTARLNQIRFDQPVRLIRPGQMVTMDFNPQRLNINIGSDETIRSLRCG